MAGTDAGRIQQLIHSILRQAGSVAEKRAPPQAGGGAAAANAASSPRPAVRSRTSTAQNADATDTVRISPRSPAEQPDTRALETVQIDRAVFETAEGRETLATLLSRRDTRAGVLEILARPGSADVAEEILSRPDAQSALRAAVRDSSVPELLARFTASAPLARLVLRALVESDAPRDVARFLETESVRENASRLLSEPSTRGLFLTALDRAEPIAGREALTRILERSGVRGQLPRLLSDLETRETVLRLLVRTDANRTVRGLLVRPEFQATFERLIAQPETRGLALRLLNSAGTDPSVRQIVNLAEASEVLVRVVSEATRAPVLGAGRPSDAEVSGALRLLAGHAETETLRAVASRAGFAAQIEVLANRPETRSTALELLAHREMARVAGEVFSSPSGREILSGLAASSEDWAVVARLLSNPGTAKVILESLAQPASAGATGALFARADVQDRAALLLRNDETRQIFLRFLADPQLGQAAGEILRRSDVADELGQLLRSDTSRAAVIETLGALDPRVAPPEAIVRRIAPNADVAAAFARVLAQQGAKENEGVSREASAVLRLLARPGMGDIAARVFDSPETAAVLARTILRAVQVLDSPAPPPSPDSSQDARAILRILSEPRMAETARRVFSTPKARAALSEAFAASGPSASTASPPDTRLALEILSRPEMAAVARQTFATAEARAILARVLAAPDAIPQPAALGDAAAALRILSHPEMGHIANEILARQDVSAQIPRLLAHAETRIPMLEVLSRPEVSATTARLLESPETRAALSQALASPEVRNVVPRLLAGDALAGPVLRILAESGRVEEAARIFQRATVQAQTPRLLSSETTRSATLDLLARPEMAQAAREIAARPDSREALIRVWDASGENRVSVDRERVLRVLAQILSSPESEAAREIRQALQQPQRIENLGAVLLSAKGAATGTPANAEIEAVLRVLSQPGMGEIASRVLSDPTRVEILQRIVEQEGQLPDRTNASPVSVESRTGVSPVSVESRTGVSPVSAESRTGVSPVPVQSRTGVPPVSETLDTAKQQREQPARADSALRYSVLELLSRPESVAVARRVLAKADTRQAMAEILVRAAPQTDIRSDSPPEERPAELPSARSARETNAVLRILSQPGMGQVADEILARQDVNAQISRLLTNAETRIPMLEILSRPESSATAGRLLESPETRAALARALATPQGRNSAPRLLAADALAEPILRILAEPQNIDAAARILRREAVQSQIPRLLSRETTRSATLDLLARPQMTQVATEIAARPDSREALIRLLVESPENRTPVARTLQPAGESRAGEPAQDARESPAVRNTRPGEAAPPLPGGTRYVPPDVAPSKPFSPSPSDEVTDRQRVLRILATVLSSPETEVAREIRQAFAKPERIENLRAILLSAKMPAASMSDSLRAEIEAVLRVLSQPGMGETALRVLSHPVQIENLQLMIEQEGQQQGRTGVSPVSLESRTGVSPVSVESRPGVSPVPIPGKTLERQGEPPAKPDSTLRVSVLELLSRPELAAVARQVLSRAETREALVRIIVEAGRGGTDSQLEPPTAARLGAPTSAKLVEPLAARTAATPAARVAATLAARGPVETSGVRLPVVEPPAASPVEPPVAGSIALPAAKASQLPPARPTEPLAVVAKPIALPQATRPLPMSAKPAGAFAPRSMNAPVEPPVERSLDPPTAQTAERIAVRLPEWFAPESSLALRILAQPETADVARMALSTPEVRIALVRALETPENREAALRIVLAQSNDVGLMSQIFGSEEARHALENLVRQPGVSARFLVRLMATPEAARIVLDVLAKPENVEIASRVFSVPHVEAILPRLIESEATRAALARVLAQPAMSEIAARLLSTPMMSSPALRPAILEWIALPGVLDSLQPVLAQPQIQATIREWLSSGRQAAALPPAVRETLLALLRATGPIRGDTPYSAPTGVRPILGPLVSRQTDLASGDLVLRYARTDRPPSNAAAQTLLPAFSARAGMPDPQVFGLALRRLLASLSSVDLPSSAGTLSSLAADKGGMRPSRRTLLALEEALSHLFAVSPRRAQRAVRVLETLAKLGGRNLDDILSQTAGRIEKIAGRLALKGGLPPGVLQPPLSEDLTLPLRFDDMPRDRLLDLARTLIAQGVEISFVGRDTKGVAQIHVVLAAASSPLAPAPDGGPPGAERTAADGGRDAATSLFVHHNNLTPQERIVLATLLASILPGPAQAIAADPADLGAALLAGLDAARSAPLAPPAPAGPGAESAAPLVAASMTQPTPAIFSGPSVAGPGHTAPGGLAGPVPASSSDPTAPPPAPDSAQELAATRRLAPYANPAELVAMRFATRPGAELAAPQAAPLDTGPAAQRAELAVAGGAHVAFNYQIAALWSWQVFFPQAFARAANRLVSGREEAPVIPSMLELVRMEPLLLAYEPGELMIPGTTIPLILPREDLL